MKTPLDVCNDLDALAALQYAAFMASDCFEGQERDGIRELLYLIHRRTEEVSYELAAWVRQDKDGKGTA